MKKILMMVAVCSLCACTLQAQKAKTGKQAVSGVPSVTRVRAGSKSVSPPSGPSRHPLSKTARALQRQGYVNVKDADSSIQVSLMYARPDNFCGVTLYDDLREAFLHPKAAKALCEAQRFLKTLRPDLSLKVYDAARPMEIQQKMWNRVKDTPRDIYVSNPAHGGGMHNYGMAVDITLCDARGDTLPMGTKIDHMSSVSHIDREAALVSSGRLSPTAHSNRQLLRRVMRHAGWMPLRTEWWHFNLCSRATARQHYKVITLH